MPTAKKKVKTKQQLVCRPLNLSQSFKSSSFNSTNYKSSLRINNKELAKALQESRLRLRNTTEQYRMLITQTQTKMTDLCNYLYRSITQINSGINIMKEAYEVCKQKDVVFPRSNNCIRILKKQSRLQQNLVCNNDYDDVTNEYEDIDDDNIILEEHSFEIMPENIDLVFDNIPANIHEAREPMKAVYICKSPDLLPNPNCASNKESYINNSANQSKTFGCVVEDKILNNLNEAKTNSNLLTIPLVDDSLISKYNASMDDGLPKNSAIIDKDKENIKENIPAKKQSNLPVFNKRKSLNCSQFKNLDKEAADITMEASNINLNVSSAVNTELKNLSSKKHNSKNSIDSVKDKITKKNVTKAISSAHILKASEKSNKKNKCIIDKPNVTTNKSNSETSVDNILLPVNKSSLISNNCTSNESIHKSNKVNKKQSFVKKKLTNREVCNVTPKRRSDMQENNKKPKEVVDIITQIGSENYRKEIVLFARKDKIPRTPIKADKVENAPKSNISSITELSDARNISIELPTNRPQEIVNMPNLACSPVHLFRDMNLRISNKDVASSSHQSTNQNNPSKNVDETEFIVEFDNSLDGSYGLLNMDEINGYLDKENNIDSNEIESVYNYLHSKKPVDDAVRINGSNDYISKNQGDNLPIVTSKFIPNSREMMEGLGNRDNKILNMNISTATQFSVATNDSSHVSFSNLQRVTKRYNAPDQDINWLAAIGQQPKNLDHIEKRNVRFEEMTTNYEVHKDLLLRGSQMQKKSSLKMSKNDANETSPVKFDATRDEIKNKNVKKPKGVGKKKNKASLDLDKEFKKINDCLCLDEYSEVDQKSARNKSESKIENVNDYRMNLDDLATLKQQNIILIDLDLNKEVNQIIQHKNNSKKKKVPTATLS